MSCIDSVGLDDQELAGHLDVMLCSSSDDDKRKSSSLDQSSSTCSHPLVMKLVCTTCGQKMSNFYGLPFDYIMGGLRLSETKADWTRDAETDFVLSKKKLFLVLDLDQTLLHSTVDLTPEENYLKNQMDSLQDIFKLITREGFSPSYAKLRPFVRNFLQEASTMFKMYVYTNANKSYARKMVNLLDPDNIYFKSRLITREDSTVSCQKNLDVVMGQERAVVILDDRTDVWPMHKDNLIQVQRYKYFASTANWSNSKSFAQREVDESTDIMATYLEILKKIHSQFFDPKLDEDNLASRDVRDVMRTVQAGILQGCKLILRKNLTAKYKLDNLSKMAEKLGAICVSELDPTVTHVVTLEAKPEDDQLQLENKKKKKNKQKGTYHLVFPEWIRDSYKLWHRMPVENYLP
ncbi:RNA polymerase II ctd phosphatase, putative [Ricinus communis]|uniref:RNA polymerase II C-terminal domain phosphatase-like n=1 Tax=Ricinus communis TaxID=3988 RepID=B9R940_RICCO|nr:RNA polymerase II ctd phosphatase, putative [Ricinus communis]